jgi:hypothetical protein
MSEIDDALASYFEGIDNVYRLVGLSSQINQNVLARNKRFDPSAKKPIPSERSSISGEPTQAGRSHKRKAHRITTCQLAECGRYWGNRAHQASARYCSTACRSKAWRLRHPDWDRRKLKV